MANIFTGGIVRKNIRVNECPPGELELAVSNLKGWSGSEKYVKELISVVDGVLEKYLNPTFLTRTATVIFDEERAVEYHKVKRILKGIIKSEEYRVYGFGDDEICVLKDLWFENDGERLFQRRYFIEFVNNGRVTDCDSIMER